MAEKQSPPLSELANMMAKIPSDRGTYALMAKCDAPFQVVAGGLGPVTFTKGYWIYVGSAFGPGGLKSRLRHHLSPSPRPHWHLDYVKPFFRFVEIWLSPDTVKQEHLWAQILSGLKGAVCPIAGFGASDCTCPAHLIYLSRRPGFGGFKKRIRETTGSRLMRIVCSADKP